MPDSIQQTLNACVLSPDYRIEHTVDTFYCSVRYSALFPEIRSVFTQPSLQSQYMADPVLKRAFIPYFGHSGFLSYYPGWLHLTTKTSHVLPCILSIMLNVLSTKKAFFEILTPHYSSPFVISQKLALHSNICGNRVIPCLILIVSH